MAYSRVNWEDSPSENTPINATNLNIMDAAIKSTSDATDTTETNPNSLTTYYPTFVSDTTGKATQRVNDGIRYQTREGTTTVVGSAVAILGNGTSQGTAKNKKGGLRIYNQLSGYTNINPEGSASDFTQTLPALTGTVCVKQGATITTETNGWYKVDMGAYTMYFLNSTTVSDTYSGNSWGGKQRNLPSGITFNDAKMTFSCGARGSDHALRVGTSISNGATAFTLSWHNAHNSSVTTTILYNATLIVFP